MVMMMTTTTLFMVVIEEQIKTLTAKLKQEIYNEHEKMTQMIVIVV